MSTVLSEYLIERGVRGATSVYSITVIKGSIYNKYIYNVFKLCKYICDTLRKYICDARVS